MLSYRTNHIKELGTAKVGNISWQIYEITRYPSYFLGKGSLKCVLNHGKGSLKWVLKPTLPHFQYCRFQNGICQNTHINKAAKVALAASWHPKGLLQPSLVPKTLPECLESFANQQTPKMLKNQEIHLQGSTYLSSIYIFSHTQMCFE